MLATQYEIPLPTDYDMGIIRRRVADRGHLLDEYPGLTLKAYLVQDVARGGQQNSYAPFYLWADTGATASFFWGGGGFSGIVRDFGRPRVSTWVGAEFRHGTAFGRAPLSATLERLPLTSNEDPAIGVERLSGAIDYYLDGDDVHSMAVVIDPTRWEAVFFTLRTSPAPEIPGATGYEVVHLSMPSDPAVGASASSVLR